MAWSNKTKILTDLDRGRILTIDKKQILAGPDENKILIYQAKESKWSKKTKVSS
jgi:hypothetical protein